MRRRKDEYCNDFDIEYAKELIDDILGIKFP
jgi:hypothetical protein